MEKMMVDKSKTKSQLLEEIKELRQRVAELDSKLAHASPVVRDISQTIIDTSPAYFVVIDAKGKTKMMNKSMLAALGYSEEEIREKDYISTFVPERDRDELASLIDQQLLKGKSTVNQNHILKKDGQELLVEWQGRPILDQNGDVEYFCGAGLDIGVRKQTEETLQRISKDEIKRREELEKLREISTSMRQAERSSSLLQVFTCEVQEFCSAEFTSSILFKSPENLVNSFNPEADIKFDEDQVQAISSALLNAKTDNLTANIPGFESTIILPLQSSDTLHGAVLVASRAKDQFKPDEQNMLNAIADMAGTALHRIDILETLEERIQRRTHDLVVLYNLITIISENWRLQDILELSLVLTLETVKADRAIIYLADGSESPNLKPVIQRGFGDGFQVETASLPDDMYARNAFTQHKALAMANLAENPEYSKFKGLKSFAGIPILARGEVRGVFSLFANAQDVFGTDEMALLASIADHLGIGIENSILWEQSRENAAIEERNRLARNLHDSVSQLLYSLTLMAGTTRKMLEREPDLDAIKNSVERFGDTAYQALKEMRLLLYELRPAVLDSEGLVSALQHRIETVESRLGLKVELYANGLPDMPSNMEDALYHIALEALNNIVKHSGSTTASIRFGAENGVIVMEVSDDGVGFDTSQPHKGLGLRNMRERGQMLGGDVIVESKPGGGTRVTAQVRIPSESLIGS